MGRVADHLSVAELERRFRACPDPVEARHVQAIWLLAQGRTLGATPEVTSFGTRWIEPLPERARLSYAGCGLSAVVSAWSSARLPEVSGSTAWTRASGITWHVRPPRSPVRDPGLRGRPLCRALGAVGHGHVLAGRVCPWLGLGLA